MTWLTCPRCSKEFCAFDTGRDPHICSACRAEVYQEQNLCPEFVQMVDYHGTRVGLDACVLQWHHEGRCQPRDSRDGLRAKP